MPQLNPAPWFSILVFSWLVFLTIIPQKVLSHTFPNEATSRSVETPKTESWNWPWN
uniref:ATP synthase complex subunit 8 n=1 Tax=Novaculichthys taeniourus TaxID=241500 RepID=Q0ZWX9_9LABR|nr:ATPase subunit 8 [Novaculichthys taeniourus]